MKHMKSRIAAVLFAAATTVCASQAITASAFEHTVNSQDYCEDAYNMGQAIKGWSRYMNYNAGETWEGTTMSGIVCGHGYATNSHFYQNQPLHGSVGFCRELAHAFFGTTTFMEHTVLGSTDLKPGDQIKIDLGSEHRWIFVVYVNGTTIDAYSLNDATNTIKRETFTRNSKWKLKLGTDKNYIMDYLVRPIKQYDANGDGIVTTADRDWVYNNIGKNQAQAGFSNKRWDIFMRALDNNDWQISYSDYYTIGFNPGVQNGLGRMTYDGSNCYYYVKM